MKQYKKIILISAAAAVIIGGALAAKGYKLESAQKQATVSNHETITENIKKINIDTDCDDISIISAKREDIYISYLSYETRSYEIGVQNETLNISRPKLNKDKTKWYDYINLTPTLDRSLIIEVPDGFNADINIDNKFGDVKVSDVKGTLRVNLNCGDCEIYGCDLDSLEASNDYGDIEIKRTTAKEAKLDNDCGDIELEDVSANLTALCDLGDIEFERLSGDNITLNVDCGDIEGTISGKKSDYEPEGTKKLNTDASSVKIEFTE